MLGLPALRNQFVFRWRDTVNGRSRARPVVNGTSQPDLLFETSCSFSRCPFRRPPPLSAVQTGPPELALYSLTERANSPFHVEPAHFLDEMLLHQGNAQPNGKIFVMKADGGDVRQLTENQFENSTPGWRPVSAVK